MTPKAPRTMQPHPRTQARVDRVTKAAANVRTALGPRPHPLALLRFHGRVAVALDRADGGERIIRAQE